MHQIIYNDGKKQFILFTIRDKALSVKFTTKLVTVGRNVHCGNLLPHI